MPTITLSNGMQFDSESNETLLEAATRENVILAYSCRTGRCSSCRCRVIDGESSILHEELGLTEQEKASGWVLSCVRVATTDMDLEVMDVDGLSLPPVKTLPCRIHSMDKLAPDVLKVMLRLPPSSDFAFNPGQHIEVIGRGGLRRSYSLANKNSAEKMLELHVRAVPGGAMSEYWFGQAKDNDLLRLNGPLGTFFLRNIKGLDLVFLATGTGIAPVKSMLEDIDRLSEYCQPRSVAVYWGGRTKNDLYLDLSSTGAGYRIVPVLSRAGNDWIGAAGYVQHIFMDDQPNLEETLVFACGSEAMIRSARNVLFTAGLPEERFLSDAFVCSAYDQSN